MVSIEFSTRERGGQVVVALRGELNVADAARVATSLAAVVASGRQMILDLADLDFIDSGGLAVLVRVRRQARQAGCDVLLAAPQQQVLTLTRLVEVFPCHAALMRRLPAPCRPPEASAPSPRHNLGARIWACSVHSRYWPAPERVLR